MSCGTACSWKETSRWRQTLRNVIMDNPWSTVKANVTWSTKTHRNTKNYGIFKKKRCYHETRNGVREREWVGVTLSPLAAGPSSRRPHCQSWFWRSSTWPRYYFLLWGPHTGSCCWQRRRESIPLRSHWNSSSTCPQTSWPPWYWKSAKRWGKPATHS